MLNAGIGVGRQRIEMLRGGGSQRLQLGCRAMEEDEEEEEHIFHNA